MSEERTARAVMAHTPLGTIIATRTSDPEHPGIWLDLRLPQSGIEIPLGLVEYSADDADFPEGEGHIITRVWGDGEPCELYHTDDLGEDSLVGLLKEILDDLEKGGGRK